MVRVGWTVSVAVDTLELIAKTKKGSKNQLQW